MEVDILTQRMIEKLAKRRAKEAFAKSAGMMSFEECYHQCLIETTVGVILNGCTTLVEEFIKTETSYAAGKKAGVIAVIDMIKREISSDDGCVYTCPECGGLVVAATSGMRCTDCSYFDCF